MMHPHTVDSVMLKPCLVAYYTFSIGKEGVINFYIEYKTISI